MFRDATVSRAFAQLFTAVTDGRPGDAKNLQVDGLILAFLAGVLHERSHLDAPRAGTAAISQARQRLDDTPAEPVTLGDLARSSGLSRFQVLRGFVRETGLTPHAYLLQRRIDLARRLIAGGRGLADVAAASGFADQSHMTRTFRRTFGIAPGAYAAAVA